MKPYEVEVFKEFEQYKNVVETWPMYDSIVICQNFFGAEGNAPGWYTTFNLFAGRETHSFFKSRTEGVCGDQYCNLKSADTMDFAMKVHSIGLEITGIPGIECQRTDIDGYNVQYPDPILGYWWQNDFPRHCGLVLKVQQDVRVELPAFACPPGYGAIGGGAAFGHTDAVAPAFGDIPFMTYAGVSGVPLLANRYPLPEPIGIPRTGNVEGILYVSEWARHILTNVTGPHMFVMNSVDGAINYNFAFSRYIIRFSLFGERLVQQRAQYHR